MTLKHSHQRSGLAPLVSIVLPTHNGSKYLAQSIDSVLAQTWPDWELIIVDDASTDSTPHIADQWAAKESRIRVVHLEHNRKLPGALNTGFELATGDFHTWTSDDNWYQQTAVARMVEVLEQDPEVAIVCADRTNVNEFGTALEISQAGTAEDLHITNRIGACFLYRREVTTALDGYDEQLFGAEDYDFWLRASLRFRFSRIAEPLYYYRYQPDSLSARRYHMIAQNVERAIRRWLPQVNWPDEHTRWRAHVEWGIRCVRAGTWEAIYEPWLASAFWLTTQARTEMRCEVLRRSTELVWEAYYRRDWNDFEKYRNYLLEVRDDPKVARLLLRRLYPRWVYSVKDRLDNVRGRIESAIARSKSLPPTA